MRRLTLLPGAFAGALVLWLGLAAPAAAGGPTSVLLVNPGSGQASGIYGSSPEYGALEKALGEPVEAVPAPRLDDLGERGITLTWMAHDVSPWRVDRVYPDVRGGMLVNRQTPEFEEGRTEWFRAADPAGVSRILAAHKLLGKDAGTSVSAPDFPPGFAEPEVAAASPAPARTTTAASPSTTAASTTDNWWWSLPGLAAGAALAAAAPYAARLRRERTPAPEEGPRQELVDV